MPIPKSVISEIRSLSSDQLIDVEKVDRITGGRTVGEILRTAPEMPATSQALEESTSAPVEAPVEAPIEALL